MPYVAVSPERTARGVHAPGIATRHTKVSSPTYDWRSHPGSEANTERITADYQVADILNAMHEVYRTDAMFVCYLLRDQSGRTSATQPRICKDAIPWLREQGYSIGLDSLAADCDLRGTNGHKRAWTPDILDIVSAKLATLKTAGFYISPHGARIVQPLSRTLDADDADAAINAWLMSLSAVECAGDGWSFAVDFRAKDWTRHSAPPNTLRDGAVYHSPLIRLDRMMPIEPPKPTRTKTHTFAARSSVNITFARTTPAKYEPMIPILAKPFIVNGYRGNRHEYYLAMVGALCKRRIDPQYVPAIAIDVAKAAKLDISRAYKDASDTTYRYVQGLQVSGMMSLPPELQQAVEMATGKAPRSGKITPKQDKTQAQASLTDLIRKAPLGLMLIQTPCGFGKTTAALTVAAERASNKPDATRAPANTKTAIAVPTHEKALEIVDKMRRANIAIKRFFGPLSVKSEDGQPVCRYPAQARALQQGGQSVAWELCEGRRQDPCPYRDSCQAYKQTDEDAHARIYVGPHAMVAQLNKAAGASGLLVIDETPSLTNSHALSEADLQACVLSHFEDAYAAVMLVVMSAVLNWMRSSEPMTSATMREILERADPSLRDMAVNALSQTLDESIAEHVLGAPPIKVATIALMRASEELAGQVGHTSAMLRAISEMILSDVSRISLLAKDDIKFIVATVVPHEIQSALTRQGACVILDAGMSTSKPLVDAIVGHDVPLQRFHVADGATIGRTLLYTPNAKRSKWLGDDGFVRLVRVAVDWILEDPAMSDAAIVSTKKVEDRLLEAMNTRQGPIWAELSRLSRAPHLGHYHALRGLDVWSDLDALVTIGDPFMNLDAVSHDAQISGQDRDELVRNRARDELEQAHGRLRVIHRPRPARLAHVGSLAPGGWEEWETRTL